MLEHIADDLGTLVRLRELLSDTGRLLLLVPAHPFLFGTIDPNVGHERRYTRRGLRRRLIEEGLTPEEVRYVNPLGALGWFVTSRPLRRQQVATAPPKRYDALVPLLRRVDRFSVPFGPSAWAVARRHSA